MTTPGPPNTSSTARLILGELGFQVGWQQPIYVPNPGAGAQWKHTVDGRYFERVVAVSFSFATSAVVANRFPTVQLTDTNGVTITSVLAGNSVAANSFLGVFLALDGPSYASGGSGSTFGFLPDLLIPPGWSWGSATFGMDPGDAFTGVTLLVQQFPNDATAITAGQ